MVNHTFTIVLKESVTNNNEKSVLISRIKKSLLYSDEYIFGKNLTTKPPIIIVNKKYIKVTVDLFKKYSKYTFKKAENKVKKYLSKYYNYKFDELNHTKKRKKSSQNRQKEVESIVL